MIGLSQADLVPTSHSINSVTASTMDLAGVFFAPISHGETETKQIVYVGHNISGFFLSKQALTDLGCIPPEFPLHPISLVNMSSSSACTCLTREATPPRPHSLPLAPVKENIPALEKWIRQLYASSAFIALQHMQASTPPHYVRLATYHHF